MDHEGNKVVQMEELITPSNDQFCDYRLLRYLHSIRDIENHTFIHCDGAVRVYNDEEFRARRGVDGSISTNEWSDIVAKWFRHDNLAGEYLATLATE